MADNRPVPMPPNIKAELARLRALMVPDAEAYRRREIGSKRMEEEAKKIQPLRPLSAADTDVEYLSAAKGGGMSIDGMRLELMSKGGSNIKKITPYIKEREGQYGLQRLQRAADEIPNLGSMYTEDALRRAFSGDNAQALMTMNPAHFERYAERIPIDIASEKAYFPKDEEMSHDEYIKYLANLKGGFADVPFLEIEKRKPHYLPSIEGHEGRHRSRALVGKGVENSLVRLLPTGRMREPMPRRYREDFIEAMKKQLGEKRLVTPEGRSLLPIDLSAQEHRNLENRNLLAANRPQLPEIYKAGGHITHAHHLDIEERPL